MPFDLIVAGGQVVTPAGVLKADIGIEAGRITAIDLAGLNDASAERLDASACLVLPGAVDVHLHYDRDGRLTDRVADATRSAVCGGVTSAVAFLLWQPGRRPLETLEQAIAELEAESFMDLGFHFYLHANDDAALEDVPACVDRGVSSFKMAMAYKRRGMMCSDEFLVTAMNTICMAGGMAMLHAESGETIDYLEQSAVAAGRTAPTDYAATRPSYAEAEAITRAATFGTATGCPIYIVHLSSRLALQHLLAARGAGQDVQAETCPQYLLLTDAEMARQGPLAKIAPPLRSPDDQAALWDALEDGAISVIASDHAPYPSANKRVGWEDIFQSPFGAPTVETLLPLVYSEGVRRRGFDLRWLTWVTSEAPARLFGLYPRKGVLQVGADADIVVLDPERRESVDSKRLHSRADYTPFAGCEALGWPVATVVGGKVLVREGELTRGPGQARFLARPPVVGRLADRLPAPVAPGGSRRG